MNWICLKYFFCLVWIEPVRDWNMLADISINEFWNSVNWTCEGLKHKSNVTTNYFQFLCELNLWGIETDWFCIFSYLITSLCELNLWGIETHFHFLSQFYIRIVWIEPVRDWNHHDGNPNHKDKVCELNLWGIETGISWIRIRHPGWVWIEPVRDWNW